MVAVDRIIKCSVLAFLLTLAFTALASAEMVRHLTVFDVRYGLVSIGKADFVIEYDRETYRLAARGKTVGVAEMVAPGTGEATSAGRITENGLEAIRHTAVYFEKRKKKKSVLEMEFEGGEVKSVKLEPDNRKRKKGRKWVAILPEQLREVIDPASSIVVPVSREMIGNPKSVCNRRLNVYDGDTRFDIKLKYKETRSITARGYEGHAYVCQLRYVPVSGHKRGERNIEYMKDNKDMEIWLAPMADSGLFTPIRIEVPTWVGRFSAVARYFGDARNLEE